MFGSSLSLSDCRANRKIDKIATGNANPDLPPLCKKPGIIVFTLFVSPWFQCHVPNHWANCTRWTILYCKAHVLIEQYFHLDWLNNIVLWGKVAICLIARQAGGRGGGFPVQPTLHLVQRAALQRNIVWRCNLSALWEQGGSKGSSQQVEIHFTLFCTEHTCGSTAQNVIYCGRWGSMVPIVDQLSSSPDIMSSPGDLEGDWAHQGKGLFGLRQIARMPIWRSTSWQNE